MKLEEKLLAIKTYRDLEKNFLLIEESMDLSSK